MGDLCDTYRNRRPIIGERQTPLAGRVSRELTYFSVIFR
jgi:hypothetical protein